MHTPDFGVNLRQIDPIVACVTVMSVPDVTPGRSVRLWEL